MSKHKYLHIFHILKCYSLFQKCTFIRKWFHLKLLFKIHRSSYILDWFWYQYNQYLMIYKESLEKVGVILRPFLAVPHLLQKTDFFLHIFRLGSPPIKNCENSESKARTVWRWFICGIYICASNALWIARYKKVLNTVYSIDISLS